MTERMDTVALLQKYAKIMWYALKPLRSKLGEDWRPRAEVLQDLRAGELKPELGDEVPIEAARQVFDLGIEY
jgi:hypothetical protein